MSVSAKKFKYAFIIPFLFCLFHISSEAVAQYSIEKKIDNGEDPSRFVWVILADGYTESELEKFQSDTLSFIDVLFSTSPWKEYKPAINIYTIFTPSCESGADHPSEGYYVDTAFDAQFDTYGIARLLTVDDAKAFDAASQVPHFDAVFVLVNDDQYGGSGGSVMVASTHEASNEIALHEAGHIIGKLADEYETPYPEYPEGDWEPNATFQIEREKIPWKYWIDSDTPLPTPDFITDNVGAFEGARYFSEDIYRPKHTCKMRSLNQPFCEICKEALILNIYNFVNPIEKSGPEETEIDLTPGSAVTLWVEPLKLDGSSYDSLWEIDDEILENESQMSFSLFPSSFKQGKHSVSIWISNVTEMVKTDRQGLLTSKQTWNVNKGFCSGKFSVSISDEKTGQDVPDATITVSNTGETLNPNIDGKYGLSDIACGVYSIKVNAPCFKTAKKETSIVDAEETILNILLEPEEGSYYVTGNITGEIKESVNVALTGDTSHSARTNEYGGFILGPAKPGSYTITPNAPGYRFSPSFRSLDIEDRNISGINFNARKSGFLFFISGIIKGDIREGIIVSVSGEKKSTTLTDSQGQFRFEDLRPGQYILKPKPLYQGLTFKPPQLKVELTKEDLKGINFLAKESSCPVSQILPKSSLHVRHLRQFRDRVLRKNEKGRYYIHLYYLLSPEVSKILQKGKYLRKESLRVLNECMPTIELLLKGNRVEIPRKTLSTIRNFAEHLSSHGSPMLKKVIEQFLKDLEQENLLQSLSP